MEVQENNKNKILTAVIITAVIAVSLSYYFYKDIKKTGKVSTSTVPAVNIEGAATTTPSINKEETKVIVNNIKVPSLDRPIVYPDNMDPKIKDDTRAKISKIISGLKSNNDSFNDWIDLGLYLKLLEDYQGAAEAWEYAGIIRPKNTASFSNLGVVYGYYLGKTALAESNFLRAIENDPNYINFYFQVYDFYNDVMKDKMKAKAIIESGIKENPNSGELKNFLSEIK